MSNVTSLLQVSKYAPDEKKMFKIIIETLYVKLSSKHILSSYDDNQLGATYV